MTRDKIGRNLVVMNGVVKCRIKRKGKFHEWTAPLQGEHAYITGRDGAKRARPALLKWLADCEKVIAEERWDAIRATHIRGGTPTVQEILAAYERECLARQATTGSPVRTTITAGKNCLKRICTACGVALTDRIDRLTPDKIDAWVRESTQSAKKGPERDHAVYVRNQELVSARCVFARWLLERYRKSGMEVPVCVTRWPTYGGIWTPRYKDPPAELKRATVEGAEKLRMEKPRVWTLYWIIVNFGTRPGDALRLRWSDFRMLPGDGGERRYLCYKPHKTRGSSAATVTIPVCAKVWQGLEASYAARKDDDALVVLPQGVRGRQGALDELNGWMRSVGWDRKTYSKASYELRKLFTSAVRNTHGVQLASDWCGSSVQMVQQYYAATYVDRMPEIDATAIISGAAGTDSSSDKV